MIESLGRHAIHAGMKIKDEKFDDHKIKSPLASTPEIDKSITDKIDLSELAEKKTPTRMRDKYEVLHEVMEAAHIASEVTDALGATGAIAAAVTLGNVAAGAFFAVEGIKDLKLAIKQKDVVGGVESAGHLSLAGEIAISTASKVATSGALAGMIGPAACAIINSPVMTALGTTFAGIHVAAEAIVGGKEIYEGIKSKDKKKILSGSLNLGVAAAVAAIILGGGAPAGIALAAVFITKMALTKSDKFKKSFVNMTHRVMTNFIPRKDKSIKLNP